ncbi:hypothetical protein V6N11_043187 [Hibiscus sabdariffa]|uniref:Uncharacterized protein n=1 Tax=Hibiscus sabdariffa TaxID=183260 RepID=A0ABR2QZA5_9ROSI
MGVVHSGIGGRTSQDGQGLQYTSNEHVESASHVQEPRVSSSDTSEVSSHVWNLSGDESHNDLGSDKSTSSGDNQGVETGSWSKVSVSRSYGVSLLVCVREFSGHVLSNNTLDLI